MQFNKLIYYPYFEATNDNWLKFALLYLDELKPIIPKSGKKNLSKNFIKIMKDTDLILPIEPEYSESEKASNTTIEIIEKILKQPEGYSSLLRSSNIKDHWKNRTYQNQRIFREKYAYHFEKFCLDNKIGRETNEGLLVASSLSNIYMTIFSNIIAQKQQISAITDQPDFDRFSFLTGNLTADKEIKQIEATKNIIKLKLPADIEEISYEKIIKLRNKPGFKKKQKAFHKEFSKFIEQAEQDILSEDFINEYMSAWKDLTSEIALLSVNTAIIGLSLYLALSSNSTGINLTETLRESFMLISLLPSSVIAKKAYDKYSKPRRDCRNFLADLKTLTA